MNRETHTQYPTEETRAILALLDQINQRDLLLAKAGEDQQKFQREISLLSLHAAELEKNISDLTTSIDWRLIRKMRVFVDRFFPAGNPIRAVMRSILRGADNAYHKL